MMVVNKQNTKACKKILKSFLYIFFVSFLLIYFRKAGRGIVGVFGYLGALLSGAQKPKIITSALVFYSPLSFINKSGSKIFLCEKIVCAKKSFLFGRRVRILKKESGRGDSGHTVTVHKKTYRVEFFETINKTWVLTIKKAALLKTTFLSLFLFSQKSPFFGDRKNER